MILFNKGFFKVWKVEQKEKYTSLQCSTGDKQQDGTYKNSNWNVRLVGDAKQLSISEGDTLIVESGKIENIWDKEGERNWLNVIVYKGVVQAGKPTQINADDDDDLPF